MAPSLRRPLLALVVVIATALTFGLVRGRSAAARALLVHEAGDLTRSLRGAAHSVLVADAGDEAPPPNDGAEPARAPVAMSNGYLGVVLARTSSDIAPRFDGRLATVNVRVGDTVSQGSLLATIAVPTLAYELRVAEAELRSANLDVDRATTELSQATERAAREQRLDNEHLAPADDVRGAYYQSRLAKTHLSSALAAAAERLQQDRDDTRIVAPFDGVVAARYAEPGTSVHALVPIVRLITTSDVIARFAVPQAEVGQLSIGCPVLIETTETHRALSGTVERIAAEVEAASHMIFVEAQVNVDAASNSVPSGELARVQLATDGP
jgi:membrane fusion protein (multidrug efflux system)/multidrug efflux system membrane fusion protein